MAGNPESQFPGKVNAADADYPQGSARDITLPGDGTGTPFVAAMLNDVFGAQQSLLAEAGITPSGTPDSVGNPQYLNAIKKVTMLSEYEPGEGPNISLSGYLDRQGVWAEDAAGIQSANNYIVGLGKRDVLKLPPRVSIPITAGLSIDTSYVSLDGNGSQIDASGMASGTAMTVTGTDASPDEQAGNFLRNLLLTGPGSGVGVTGLLFENGGGGLAGPSRVSMAGVGVESFIIGELYGANAFLIVANSCHIRDCGIGVQIVAASNGGENLARFGGSIYDCVTAITTLNSNGILSLHGVSLINNTALFNVTGGHISAHGCVMEGDGVAATTPIIISGDGAGVDITGGELTLTGAAAFNHWVDVGANSFFRMRGARMVDGQTVTHEFATGDGAAILRDMHYEGSHGNPLVLHSDRSMLADGGFEESTVVDDIFITDSTVTGWSRLNGSNIQLQVSAGDSHSGAQALRYSKPGAAATASRFVLASIPVRAFDRVSGRCWWRKPGSSTGSFTFRYSYARMGVNADSVPYPLHQTGVANSTKTLTGADSGWLMEEFDLTGYQAPEWATHILVEINGLSWDANGGSEYIYFDDLNVNILG